MKKQSSLALLCAVAVVVAVLLGEASVVKAVTCNPTELSPCIDAFTSSRPPSTTCCVKVREQRPCYCKYIKDPNLSQYAKSPNTKRIVNTCGVSIPTC